MESKIIHYHLYRPDQTLFKAEANARAQTFLVHCSNSDNCELHDRGECAMRSSLGCRCPYGKRDGETGFTRRARKYHSWIGDQNRKYEGSPSLTSPTDKIAVVGDYIYLPYAHMNGCEHVFGNDDYTSTSKNLLHKDKFTVKNIIHLLDFRPMALFFPQEITSYQQEEIPQFVKHLHDQFPELYDQVAEEYPRIKTFSLSNVGRKAFVKTLKPNVGSYTYTSGSKTSTWWWDGEYIYATDTRPYFDIISKDYVEALVKLKPSDKMYVTVELEEQVTENTVFKE